jgi:preprotein translocase subunit SecF
MSQRRRGVRGLWSRLYRGETAFDFVGKRRRWFIASVVVIIVGGLSLGVKGLNFGIEFKGGTDWQVVAPSVSVNQARSAMSSLGLPDSTITVLGGKTLDVQANVNSGAPAHQAQVKQSVTNKLASLAHVQPSQVSINDVGPTWGHEITTKAEYALLAFFLAIAFYITLRFEWKMAVAAIVAVIHDILVTAGIYSLSGLQVTPATVVAFLTILGYSLYDTIVVFDRVQENTKGLASTGRLTYSDMVNLSMNQTLMRSINTSFVALLPILSILVIGAQFLGAKTLQEFGLALFIGLASGAYSSIFIASPLLAMMKEREGRYATIRQRLSARGEAMTLLTPAAAAAARGGGSQQGALVRAGSGTGRGSRAGRAGGDGAGVSGDGGTPHEDGVAAESTDGAGQGPAPTPAARPRPSSTRGRPSSRRSSPRPRKKGKRR